MTKVHFPKNHSFDVAKYRLVVEHNGKVVQDNFVPVNQPECTVEFDSTEGIVVTLYHYDSNSVEVDSYVRDLADGVDFIPEHINFTELPVEQEVKDIADSIRRTYLENDEDAGEQISEVDGWNPSA